MKKTETLDAAAVRALAAKTPGKRRNRSTPANALNAACLLVLKLRGIKAWKNETQGQYDPLKKVYRKFRGLKGVSDILGILPNGRFLAVETKTPRDRLRPEQEQFLSDVRRWSGVALCVRSETELEARLKAEGY